MSDTLARAHDHLTASDRRLYPRQPIRSLAYVELDEGNGGIVLNISEGGLSVQAVTSLMDDVLPGVRFQLSESEAWVEAKARITWTDQSRKLAGLEFVALSDEARGRIREWLVRESLPAGSAVEAGIPSKENRQPATTSGSDEATVSTVQAADPAIVAQDRVEEQRQDAAPVVEVAIAAPRPPNSEAISPPVKEALAPVSDQGHETPVGPSVQPVDTHSSSAVKLIRNHWVMAALLVLLAIASLAAGWAAGEGEVGKTLEGIRKAASQNGASGDAIVSSTAAPVARLSEIEVVNNSNQRWTIPFDGPLSSSDDGTRRQASGNILSQARKPQAGFRTWILAPPQQARAAADNSALIKENPPVLEDAPASTESVLTSSGAINSHALAGPPALRAPDPPPPASVKQGHVIRLVDPVYPMIARDQRVEGTVRLNVTISEDGIVRGVELLGGPRLLVGAAEEAVRQWRYAPTILDGKPVEIQKEVDLRFHLSDSAR